MKHEHDDLQSLLTNNKDWVKSKLSVREDYFSRLKNIQTPKYLWIGCSDSRVPANEIVGLEPGEMFVHRNIANVVVQTDMNCMSVLQYAVEILKVEHIIVTGHYGCGGVKAAMENSKYGLIDNWLREIKTVYQLHKKEVESMPEDQRFRKMCELNVKAQVLNTAHSSVLQYAWAHKQEVSVHGWIFDVGDGILHDLGISIHGPEQTDPIFQFDQ